MKIQKKIIPALMAMAVVCPSYVAAEYHASSDTGMGALDYIENRRRAERENALTEEQKKLLADVEYMRTHLRRPWDETKPLPVAFEGDDLTYDERTGDFIAKGKVDILQMDASRFQSEDVSGNVKAQHIEVPGKVHLLRMAPDTPRVTLDGYRANYDYGAKTGSLEDASGKVDRHYITGKRFEFYPDHIVVYQGTETRCSAKNPDYHTQAEKIEIWPDDKAKLYKVSFWIGKWMVAKRNYYETGIGENADKKHNVFPTVGVNKDDGLYLRYNLTAPLAKHISANSELLASTKEGFHGNSDITYQNRNTTAQVVYGYYEDSDDRWIQKQPSFVYRFDKHMKDAPLAYSLSYEGGRWRDGGIKSTHQRYGVNLAHDPIELHKGFTLHLKAGYAVTRESFNDSKVQGMNWDAVLTKDFNWQWAAYMGAHYSKESREDSLFGFDTEDYPRRLETGLSYRMDEHNRFAVGVGYDAKRDRLRDVDYYWYHDIHCSQIILRYRAKRDSFQVKWEFAPW